MKSIVSQIDRLASLENGWDGYVAEPPSAEVRAKALLALEALIRLGTLPIRAAAMADGGVALVLEARPSYVALEISNDGEAVLGYSDRKTRHEAWETGTSESALRAALKRLSRLRHG